MRVYLLLLVAASIVVAPGCVKTSGASVVRLQLPDPVLIWGTAERCGDLICFDGVSLREEVFRPAAEWNRILLAVRGDKGVLLRLAAYEGTGVYRSWYTIARHRSTLHLTLADDLALPQGPNIALTARATIRLDFRNEGACDRVRDIMGREYDRLESLTANIDSSVWEDSLGMPYGIDRLVAQRKLQASRPTMDDIRELIGNLEPSIR